MSMNELRTAVNEFACCYTYAADYTINDSDIITHHRIISSIPAILNTIVKRSFTFNGDTLILSNNTAHRKLLWLRQKIKS